MKVADVDLSRTLAHALRHEPDRYGLEVDAQGWVPLADVVDSLQRKGGAWRAVTAADVRHVVEHGTKPRYEIDGARIRARYGHSLPGGIERATARPPATLFHGTSPAAADRIADEGLRPMSRQYVHLSEGPEDAAVVGRRKAPEPVILVIDAAGAHTAGVPFRPAHDGLWLAAAIPAAFIERRAT